MNGNDKKKTVLVLSETNFILDITFEQAPECTRLLSLTEEQGLDIVIPEFSFAEAEGNITKTLQRRCITIDNMLGVLRQSARSPYQQVTPLITALEQWKAYSLSEELVDLHARMDNLENIVRVIAFSGEIAAQAELRSVRQLAPFKPTDRNVYESILQFARLNQQPALTMLFLTRDKADFDFPCIRAELAALSVELFFSAGDCIRRIRELVERD